MMITRRLPTLIVATLIVGGALALSIVPAAASRRVLTPATSTLPPAASPGPDRRGIDMQMSALDRRARFDMILYVGTFHRADSALRAIALTSSAR